jgi:hypothetical protein
MITVAYFKLGLITYFSRSHQPTANPRQGLPNRNIRARTCPVTTALSTIPHVYNNVVILQCGDGYWNATAMCKANRKLWADYWRNSSTQEFLGELSSVMGIPITELVQVRHGGPPSLQGTWVHRRVAIDLARWLSPPFAVWVNGWVEESLTRRRVEPAPERPTLKPYTDRVMLLPSIRGQVPPGHSCVFVEAADLLNWAELIILPAGLEMQDYDLLDGSVGKRWVQFREGKEWAGCRVHYVHQFPPGDPRGAREAWAYPMSELAHFREWLQREYIQLWFPDYLQRRYGAARLLQAAPALRRLGLNLPNVRPQDRSRRRPDSGEGAPSDN